MSNYQGAEMHAQEMADRLTAASHEIDQLRAALAAANARAEAAEADAAMCDHYAKRALEAEAALAAVPWGAISLVVWMLDDGPYDEIAVDEVNRWLDAQPDLAKQRSHDIEDRISELKQQSEVQP